MKTITPFLLRFALFASLLTIAFRFFISYGIDNKSTILVGIVAVVYFLSLFFGGWYFGKKDGNYLPIYDVGFRFHLTIYLIYNVISEGWFFSILIQVLKTSDRFILLLYCGEDF